VPGIENPKRLILLSGGLKLKALKIYLSHRLAGMGEGATLAIMAKTMRETDMFDQ
jgi:hypothetical protein